jgi:NCS1 family nucleobase:cation symporter-1
MGWLLSFVTAGTIYYVLRLFVKVKVHPPANESMPTTFEYMAKNGREGFFDGEREDGVVLSGNSSDIETANEQGPSKEKEVGETRQESGY